MKLTTVLIFLGLCSSIYADQITYADIKSRLSTIHTNLTHYHATQLKDYQDFVIALAKKDRSFRRLVTESGKYTRLYPTGSLDPAYAIDGLIFANKELQKYEDARFAATCAYTASIQRELQEIIAHSTHSAGLKKDAHNDQELFNNAAFLLNKIERIAESAFIGGGHTSNFSGLVIIIKSKIKTIGFYDHYLEQMLQTLHSLIPSFITRFLGSHDASLTRDTKKAILYSKKRLERMQHNTQLQELHSQIKAIEAVI